MSSEALGPGVVLHEVIDDLFQSDVWNQLILGQVSTSDRIEMTNSLQININITSPATSSYVTVNS